MIEVRGLCKTYVTKESKGFFKTNKNYLKAVDNLSINIKKGEITGLLGINGAGKTTTVKMLSTLLEPTRGDIIYDGMDIKKNEKIIKSKVNMIAGGERMIYWRLTAKENLKYFGSMYGLHGKYLNERIDYLLELVGLQDKKNIPVEKFSKGMKQRLQIARGLINDPDYIFLDEPTLGLDIQIAKEMREFFLELVKKQDKGILLTTHYMKEVEELCRYIYILNEGKLLTEGSVEDITKMSTTEDGNLEDVLLMMAKEVSIENKEVI
ncbi:ABC transporter ATP-binding protein [Vallitalea guaymasensis]|uniref:ABC transporter ATP-binding protein n=1 Tax=Vallitalea guaymasensis TaxID=1185412 RepID=UPI0023565D38|nr:ABC transporter ATP-binding protein [Vallitalea guaymasensis]